MKYSQIITQLRQWLPFFTDFFSDTLTSTDAINNAGTVTITFGGQSIPEGVKVGDQVCVTDALELVAVDGAASENGIILVGTLSKHDYTSDISGQQIRITGSGYDETFTLLYVPNRYELELQDDGQPLPTTGCVVNQANVTTFSGTRTITAINTATPSISYVVPNTTSEIATTGIRVHFTGRISGCLDPTTLTASYTAQPNDDSGWLFVTMGAPIANKSRTNGNDAVDTLQTNQDFRQSMIFNFSIFVVVPSKGTDDLDVSGMRERDKIEDIRQPIFKAILGWKPTVNLNSYGTNSIVYAGESPYAYTNKAMYIHRFDFQWNADLTAGDTFLSIDNTTAFRDIYLTQQPPNSDTILQSEIDLDDIMAIDDLPSGFGSAFGAGFGAS